MTVITKQNRFFIFFKGKENNMISSWQRILYLSPSLKNIITFLCWFVFLVFNTLQQKIKECILLLKSNIINNIPYSDRDAIAKTIKSRCLSMFIWQSSRSCKYIDGIYRQQKRIYVARIRPLRGGTTKLSFSFKLNCLHCSNTNGRNYHIIIRIIIIHFRALYSTIHQQKIP